MLASRVRRLASVSTASRGSPHPGRNPGSDRGVLIAAAADPLAATRSLLAALLDVPRGTPPLLTSRVRRLASVSTASLGSPHPGRNPGSDRGVLIAAAADPLAATRSLLAALLDVPRGTPPLLTSRVRRLASVSTASL